MTELIEKNILSAIKEYFNNNDVYVIEEELFPDVCLVINKNTGELFIICKASEKNRLLEYERQNLIATTPIPEEYRQWFDYDKYCEDMYPTLGCVYDSVNTLQIDGDLFYICTI